MAKQTGRILSEDTKVLIKEGTDIISRGAENELLEWKRKAKADLSTCLAVKGNNSICTSKPYYQGEETNGRCAKHSGSSGKQGWQNRTEESKQRSLANLHPQARLVHGLNTKDFDSQLQPHERDMIVCITQEITDQIGEENITINDRINIHRYATAVIKVHRVDHNMDYALNQSIKNKDMTKEMLELEKQLGIDRRYRLSRGNVENPTEDVFFQLFDMPKNDN